MSHCHSVITLLGTISYSTLFPRPCESCYKTIRLMIQAFNSITSNSGCPTAVSYGAQMSCRFWNRALFEAMMLPYGGGGGAIYAYGP